MQTEHLHSALAEEKLAKAKSAIILGDPFFASLMFKLQFKVDYDCETLWTDSVSIGYNPEYIETLSIDQIKGVIIHEIMHCVGKHPMRRGERNHSTWNLACDYAINPLITQTGKYALPDGAANDIMFENKSSEEIYSILERMQRDQQKNDGNPEQQCYGGTGGGNGDQQQDQNQQQNPDQQQQDPDQQQQQPQQPQQPQDPGKCGETRDYPVGADEGGEDNSKSMKQAMNEWDMAAVQAAEAAKSCGFELGGELQRLIENIKNPKQPWKEVLARFLEEISYNDYDWESPNRQYLGKDIILPSLYGKTFGDIAIAVDVSGSISEQDIKEMLAEVFGILQTFEETGKENPEIPIIYCSSRVHGHEIIGLDDEPHPIGTGGTRFSPAIEWAAEYFPESKALIYLTDGYCNDFGPEPEFEVLWGICFDGIDRFNPPFGEVIYMEENE